MSPLRAWWVEWDTTIHALRATPLRAVLFAAATVVVLVGAVWVWSNHGGGWLAAFCAADLVVTYAVARHVETGDLLRHAEHAAR